jgi:hypothetical protein
LEFVWECAHASGKAGVSNTAAKGNFPFFPQRVQQFAEDAAILCSEVTAIPNVFNQHGRYLLWDQPLIFIF